MHIHWSNTAVIERPIDELWAIFVDLFNTPRLPGGSMALRLTTPGPMALGSTAEGRRMILGFETKITERVEEWDPPKLMGVVIEGRQFKAYEHFTLETGTDGTLCVDSLDIELRMPLKLIGLLLEPILRRQRTAQFRQMQTMFENGFGRQRETDVSGA